MMRPQLPAQQASSSSTSLVSDGNLDLLNTNMTDGQVEVAAGGLLHTDFTT